MASVTLDGVSKQFADVKAVDSVSVKIDDKEFLTLLGPSGCGKTTALRLIAGLETPTAGRIFIGDRFVNDIPPKSRDIAMVFQSYALYPHMTVRENIAFPLKLRKLSKSEIDARVRKTAELLKISHLLGRRPKQLSGGEQQRVALGRAIVREPKVFLMDEPLSNLDAKLRIHMRAELKALQKRLGITTVYVTHDQVEAMTMSDRIALMEKGQLLQTATPAEIYMRPADMSVAGFIGNPPMNFIDCSFVERGDTACLETGTFTFDVTELRDFLKMFSAGSEMVLGIRPEDIDVSIEKVPRSIESRIYVIEPLGSELILDISIGEALIRVKCSAKLHVSSGDPVWLLFNPSRMHFFDKKTGKILA
jgi:multiple sugar transport system ATP-binding protein